MLVIIVNVSVVENSNIIFMWVEKLVFVVGNVNNFEELLVEWDIKFNVECL